MQWINNVNKILEPLYYLASIGLFATVIIGLYQLKILKADIKIKNQRASMEKSLEYLDWFASDFFPTVSNYREQFDELKQAMLSKAPNDNAREVISKAIIESANVEIKMDDRFQKTDDECKEKMIAVSLMLTCRADRVLNQLEYFAAAMTCGLADEELAFNPLSEAYCNVIEEFYYVLCYMRSSNGKLYSNILKLYKTWKPRIDKEELQGKHQELAEKLSQLPDTKIKTLGL